MPALFTTIQINRLASISADIKLAITRKEVKAAGVIWVPELAPSKRLFDQSWAWKRVDQWPSRWPDYERIFKEEMQTPEKMRYLKHILRRLDEGKSIAAACFCSWTHDHMYQGSLACHRRLIAEWVQALGYPTVIN